MTIVEPEDAVIGPVTVIAPHRRWRWPLPAWPLGRVPEQVGQLLRGQLALELLGAALVVETDRAQPALEVAGARAARAALIAAVVVGWPHVLIRPWQANAWGRWWRGVTDTLTTPTLLAGAICWAICWVGLAIGVGSLWFLAPAVVSLPSINFEVGRLVYASTRRGEVRGRFDGEGLADWAELHRHTSAVAVRRHAVRTRPAIARRAAGGRR